MTRLRRLRLRRRLSMVLARTAFAA